MDGPASLPASLPASVPTAVRSRILRAFPQLLGAFDVSALGLGRQPPAISRAFAQLVFPLLRGELGSTVGCRRRIEKVRSSFPPLPSAAILLSISFESLAQSTRCFANFREKPFDSASSVSRVHFRVRRSRQHEMTVDMKKAPNADPHSIITNCSPPSSSHWKRGGVLSLDGSSV
jgi:hypothetical protein